jgi:signal transduction histidine kinase/DNA-binding response OmpR family regulator
MKKTYILLFALPVLFITLMYLSIWWFVGGVAAIMVFIMYSFYASRMKTVKAKSEEMEQQVEQLHAHLDHSIVKEQKASKDAEQVRQSKQQLLTIIGHEIRTPLNGVMGMALLLEDTPLTNEQQEYIKTIRGCGESLLTTVNDILVNDILDFSKLQQEGAKLEYKDFDLRDCVEEVLEMFADKTGKAGLDLMYYIDADVTEQIIGDSKRLRQLLMNLVENAVKFTPHGEVFVGIHSLNNAEGNNPQLNFEVRDTGIGMANDQIKQLFNGIPGKEFQKDDGTEALGLGLVISRKLVELMGGHIEVKSELGQGSTFNFIIPVIPSLKSIRNHAQYDNMVNLEGKHILIADDNSTSRTILMKQMQSWKMLPVRADSGKQALEILSKNNDFSLVLADMNMPEMNGMQLTKSIRNKYPAMPVILMNQAGDEQYKQEPGLFASVLTKPMRQFMLRDHILGIFSGTGTDKKINAGPSLSGDFSAQYPLRILIAEDNLINQKIAIKILGKLGYQPALANNGKEVMEMVALENYDIILMDVQMPEMSGLEATKMIRICLEVQPVIIAMTANTMQGDRDDCIQAGMDDYMSKPIDLKELLNQLEKWALMIREKRKASA